MSASPIDKFSLARLRTTIGRSARSDVCIPDAFASRLHAEVRKEGDGYWLQDLGSANGTRYNGSLVTMPIPLVSGGEIQIGETRIVFEDEQMNRLGSSTLIADSTEALDPSKTISLTQRKNPTTEILDGQFSSRTELLGLISKVGVALLSSSGLDETLDQVASLVFEAVPGRELRDHASRRESRGRHEDRRGARKGQGRAYPGSPDQPDRDGRGAKKR